MSRKSEFQNENPNPAKYFLEWKSDHGCFQYYDKEREEKIKVDLPFRFLVLKEMHTVKGWNDASDSAIYSNEVKFIGSQDLHVRSFKGGEIATGLYSEIKHLIHAAGGYYTKSIYIMTESNNIFNIQLKGSAVGEWSEFTKKSKARLADEWVSVTGAEQRKKGNINYTVPVFKYDQSLDQESASKADKVYAELDMYMKAYLQADQEDKIVDAIKNEYNPEYREEEDSDLPF